MAYVRDNALEARGEMPGSTDEQAMRTLLTLRPKEPTSHFPDSQVLMRLGAAVQAEAETLSRALGRKSAKPGEEAGAATEAGKRSGRNSSASYASRHQLAEQKRRARINERLDALRNVVPHRDRANTSEFLDEVLAYIITLQSLVAQLEARAKANEKVVAYAGMPEQVHEPIYMASAPPGDVHNHQLLGLPAMPYAPLNAHGLVREEQHVQPRAASSSPSPTSSRDAPAFILVPASIGPTRGPMDMPHQDVMAAAAANPTKKRRTR